MKEYSLIYVSCKFGGDMDRIKLCEEFIKELMKEDRKNGVTNKVYISPLHTFGWTYDLVDYDRGLDMALSLLDKCDYMYVVPDYEGSKGCLQEIGFCKAKGIPIRFL